MERVLQIIAVVLIGVAAFFLWGDDGEGAFVSAVLGCAAFFMSIRYQAKRRVDKRNEEMIEEKYGTFENKKLSATTEIGGLHEHVLTQDETDSPIQE